jgi:hypothetical protein
MLSPRASPGAVAALRRATAPRPTALHRHALRHSTHANLAAAWFLPALYAVGQLCVRGSNFTAMQHSAAPNHAASRLSAICTNATVHGHSHTHPPSTPSCARARRPLASGPRDVRVTRASCSMVCTWCGLADGADPDDHRVFRPRPLEEARGLHVAEEPLHRAPRARRTPRTRQRWAVDSGGQGRGQGSSGGQGDSGGQMVGRWWAADGSGQQMVGRWW